MNIDYRDFDANDIEPLFEFGFGLSYTNFEYFGLQTDFSNDFAAEGENWLSGLASSEKKRGSAVEDWYALCFYTISTNLIVLLGCTANFGL